MVFNKRKKYGKMSYSQCGEDILIGFIFHSIGILKPRFLDIGAHHPYYLNNTAIFYEAGCNGVNIEPDPSLIKEFYSQRGRDININKGISDCNSILDFYIMSSPTLNTFSKKEAYDYEKLNYKIQAIKKIEVVTIDYILEKYLNNKFPELLTIDAEGVDEIILKSIDYSLNFPIVICVETISFSNVGKGVKNLDLIEFIKSNGYLLYADTYINSIFVKEDIWKRDH